MSSEFNGKARARKLPTGPGVYVMRDEQGKPLYVGKAANLRKRVASYFDARPKVDRIMRMVGQIRDIEVGLTHSEGEALLLENEWIKSLKPRYNVLLRDDKSYPWLMLTADHDFPRIAFHRGGHTNGRRYFGPYPSARSVRESINLMQKIFRIRNCEDSYFSHRTRPCLQHQIKRCTAPCVGLVSADEYARQIDDAVLYLNGKGHRVIDRLVGRMEHAAETQNYEQAALFRDQINTLKSMQSAQWLPGRDGDLDFIALAREGRHACVLVVSFRGHRNIGQRSFFPTQAEGFDDPEIMQAFLGQYFTKRLAPPQIVINQDIRSELLEEVLSERAGRRVRIQSKPRSERRQWLRLTEKNARHALETQLAGGARSEAQLNRLAERLGLDTAPSSIECFDISHFSGGQTVGACVAFDRNGPVKSRYRRYTINDVTRGDDYAAMAQALRRRYRKTADGEDMATVPDLILIDGGIGQVRKAQEVLDEYGLVDQPLLGVSKGRARRAGYEEWVLADGTRFVPGPECPEAHLVQQVRDEAHRFAITGHRGQRQKRSVRSSLEEIPGVGASRRRALLTQLGGIKGVRAASAEQLASVPGISQALAKRIFRALH